MLSFLTPILSDPQLGISKHDQVLIAGTVKARWLTEERSRVPYIIGFVVWAFLFMMAFVFFRHAGLFVALTIVLVWGLGQFGIAYLIIRFCFRPMLYQELHDRGYDICLRCSYILIDLPPEHTNCPECGTVRTPLPTELEAESKTGESGG